MIYIVKHTALGGQADTVVKADSRSEAEGMVIERYTEAHSHKPVISETIRVPEEKAIIYSAFDYD